MENIKDKSRSKELIQNMQNLLDGASSVPLSQGKVSIYKDEMQTLLTELATQMDIELKTYYEVNDRRGKIISEAKKEAEKIILEAEQTASRVRVSKSATGVSPLDVSRLNQEELDSLSNANEIYGASLIYTDEMLTEVGEMIETAYHNIRSDYEIVMQVMEEKMNTIQSNRNELMSSLQEMDGAERSQQILEIGQLLSSELYRSRMKEKMNSDEYEDGSVQLSLELVEEQEEKARQAQEKADRAQAALAQMTAERDALRQTVQMMKNEGMAATVKDVKGGNSPFATTFENRREPVFVQMQPATPQATVSPQAATVTPQATVSPQAATVTPQATVSPQAATVTPQATVSPQATVVTPQATVSPQAATVTPQAATVTPQATVVSPQAAASPQPAVPTQPEENEDYEVVYVSEDELEDGEEYEVEYVDDDEYEEIMSKMGKRPEPVGEGNPGETIDAESVGESNPEKMAESEAAGGSISKENAEAIPKGTSDPEDEMDIPLIPRFKKAEKIGTISSEQMDSIKNGVVKPSVPVDKGLIGRAVKEKEKTQLENTIQVDSGEPVKKTASKKKHKKDPDIKTDSEGNEYVQATMKFDEDFEITEF